MPQSLPGAVTRFLAEGSVWPQARNELTGAAAAPETGAAGGGGLPALGRAPGCGRQRARGPPLADAAGLGSSLRGWTGRGGRETKVKEGPESDGSAAAGGWSGVSDVMTDSEEVTGRQDSFVHLPEEFKLGNSALVMTPKRLQQEIEKYKERCQALEQDQLELGTAKEAAENKTRGFQKEAELLRGKLEREKSLSRELESSYQELCLAKEERDKLLQEKQELEKELEERRVAWEKQAKAPPSLPDRKMLFKGHVTEAKDVNALVVAPRIQRALPGGSALLTFEEPEVAQRILEMKWHEVKLDESAGCEGRLRVQAEPVELLLPSALEIEMKLSDRCILLSSLPRLDLSEEQLLDKLEIFFSKKKNGGSEVEQRELLSDSGHVVLTFVHNGVAEQLTKKGLFQVPIGKQTYELKVTPYISGQITNLQVRPSVCAKTVLLSGISDILDEESMRDALEIHFQKPSRGGGEVDALGYVPVGKRALAVFEEDTD
ncbi:interferon-induced 35 kDa protein isoform X2 [Dermochelys coriacea]|uniref:interferon-induced 35 kDa protein isoform X2 n=1 Tax=Dermochelys coriacea TaxID=27794 RepID=UPI001CA93CE9|nr:interferon-induced 35 kDa protein isoform X2 [Dermochelys coriacea]